MKSLKIPYKKIWIASDHGGYKLKQHLIERYQAMPLHDLGPDSEDSVDYPDYAQKVCLAMKDDLTEVCGVLVCGSGQGMAIKANRYSFIRAALCWSEEVAALARQHNDANILCLPGRLIPFPIAEKVFETFLTTTFEGGRHARRVEKLGSAH
ncbi:MAG: RpiB/LacA/LacB family sugar-phosphate isomerase [Bdellovibrionales bacterium]